MWGNMYTWCWSCGTSMTYLFNIVNDVYPNSSDIFSDANSWQFYSNHRSYCIMETKWAFLWKKGHNSYCPDLTMKSGCSSEMFEVKCKWWNASCSGEPNYTPPVTIKKEVSKGNKTRCVYENTKPLPGLSMVTGSWSRFKVFELPDPRKRKTKIRTLYLV